VGLTTLLKVNLVPNVTERLGLKEVLWINELS
jgi:hypothetical protein